MSAPSLSLSEACSKLWDLDENRLVPGRDYKISLQGDTKVYLRKDMASDKLFTWVKEDIFTSHKTYKCFYDLLDNYERETGVEEVVTQQVGKCPIKKKKFNFILNKKKKRKKKKIGIFLTSVAKLLS